MGLLREGDTPEIRQPPAAMLEWVQHPIAHHRVGEPPWLAPACIVRSPTPKEWLLAR